MANERARYRVKTDLRAGLEKTAKPWVDKDSETFLTAPLVTCHPIK